MPPPPLRGLHDLRAVHGSREPGEVTRDITEIVDWRCRRCGHRFRDPLILAVMWVALTPCLPAEERPAPRRERGHVPEHLLPDGEVWIGDPEPEEGTEE